MKKTIVFEYALGNKEDLFEGSEELQIGDSLDSLDFETPPGKIVRPQFVGVFQSEEIEPENEEEEEEWREEGMDYLMARRRMDELMGKILRLHDEEENAAPNLIHVGYDREVMRRNTANAALGRFPRRVKLSPYENMPHFESKRTEVGNICLEILARGEDENLALPRGEEIGERETRIMGSGYKELEMQRKKYGLTREEFASLLLFDKRVNGEPSKKLMDHPSLLNISSELLGLDEYEG